jgi:hemolysin activation/secretion protein
MQTKKMPKRLKRLLGIALLGLPATLAFAQAPADPRFEIKRFRVEGSTALSAQEAEAVLAPFTGPDRTLADIQRAREALEAAFSRKGYGAVQVLLPEQEVARGEVVLRAMEARVGKVTVEGNRFFDEANIRASLPALRPGEAPNTAALANNLRVANENPAKQTTVTLRTGAAEGEVDAVVRVADQNPQRFLLSLDNTGTPETGDWRVGVGYQYANLWRRDHVVNLQYLTSPSQDDDPDQLALPPNKNVFIVGGSYRIPLYSLGDSIDLIAGYANVNSGVVQNVFNISGAGRVYAGRYNWNLPRWRELEQRIAFGADLRYYDNDVVPVGTSIALVPDYVVHPLSATYSGTWRAAQSETSAYAGAFRNIPGGPNGDQAQFDLVRPGAQADYLLYRAGFNHLHSLPADLQFRFNMSGQYTPDELVPGEQFGIGGQDSVRGFLEREFINDKGFRGTTEVYSPDFGPRTGIGNLRLRLLAFYDWGQLTRNDPQPFDTDGTHIGSTGVGLRLFHASSLSLRADYARVVDGAGSQPTGSSRGHLSVIYAF